MEVVKALKERGMHPDPNFQIFVDGGVRRASDVLKAIAVGATAGSYMTCSCAYVGSCSCGLYVSRVHPPHVTVGIGRPFIYAYSTYGQQGDRDLDQS